MLLYTDQSTKISSTSKTLEWLLLARIQQLCAQQHSYHLDLHDCGNIQSCTSLHALLHPAVRFARLYRSQVVQPAAGPDAKSSGHDFASGPEDQLGSVMEHWLYLSMPIMPQDASEPEVPSMQVRSRKVAPHACTVGYANSLPSVAPKVTSNSGLEQEALTDISFCVTVFLPYL